MSYGQRLLLTQPCLACNREYGQPMCDLCQDLEDAEERATDPREDEPSYAND